MCFAKPVNFQKILCSHYAKIWILKFVFSWISKKVNFCHAVGEIITSALEYCVVWSPEWTIKMSSSIFNPIIPFFPLVHFQSWLFWSLWSSVTLYIDGFWRHVMPSPGECFRKLPKSRLAPLLKQRANILWRLRNLTEGNDPCRWVWVWTESKCTARSPAVTPRRLRLHWLRFHRHKYCVSLPVFFPWQRRETSW